MVTLSLQGAWRCEAGQRGGKRSGGIETRKSGTLGTAGGVRGRAGGGRRSAAGGCLKGHAHSHCGLTLGFTRQ